MQFAGGLILAFLSALGVNWAYTRQHDAVARMPPLSVRRPLELLSRIATNRGWLLGFGSESIGWLCYLGALLLAPLSLVQGIGASGIAVLALASVRGQPGKLSAPEKLAVVLGFGGLVLLSLSVVDTTQTDRTPPLGAVAVWLAATFAGGALLAGSRARLTRAPALGLAAGLLFGGGDICSKLVVFGHLWLIAAAPLLAAYALGTGLLQSAFQHGHALTGAGLATLATNAVPIVAGFALFDEQLPDGGKAILQLLGFALLVGSAILLAQAANAPRSATAGGERETLS